MELPDADEATETRLLVDSLAEVEGSRFLSNVSNEELRDEKSEDESWTVGMVLLFLVSDEVER